MRYTIIASLFIFAGIVSDLSAQGSIIINQDPKIEQLRSLHAWYNSQLNTRIPGFQVIAITTTNRTEATNAKVKLLRQFPSHRIDLNYDQEPYYRVMIGAYRSRLEAESLKFKMRETFPTAFIGINRDLRPVDFRPVGQ